MSKLFYNFTMGGANRGYSYLYIDSLELHSITRFKLDDDSTIFTNIFKLKLNNQDVLACKHNDLDWVDLSQHPAKHFPSCAYPLLLPKALSTAFTYVQISEDDGSVIGDFCLAKQQNDIVESCEGNTKRRFTMSGKTPIRIDWGGAISHRCSDAHECVRGSGLAFSLE